MSQEARMQQLELASLFSLYLTLCGSSESVCVKVVRVALSWQSKTRLTNRPLFLTFSGCSQKKILREMAHWHT